MYPLIEDYACRQGDLSVFLHFNDVINQNENIFLKDSCYEEKGN